MRRRILAVAASAGLLLGGVGAGVAFAHHCGYSGGAPIGGVNCFHEGEGTISGTDRYATAVAISQTFWEPGEAPYVYLANGQTFVDAVAAGPSVDGPILLVPTGREIPDAVYAEIARLAPTGGVVRLGGDNAVHPDQLAIAAIAAGFPK